MKRRYIIELAIGMTLIFAGGFIIGGALIQAGPSVCDASGVYGSAYRKRYAIEALAERRGVDRESTARFIMGNWQDLEAIMGSK